MVILNDFATVDHLAVPLALKGIKDELGVLRFGGSNFLPIKQLQSVQYCRGLLGAVLPGDGSQSVLRGLCAVVAGDQD